MQNLRARAYDPASGRFIGLDRFAGNMQDPQSLHKYAYVHGDPVQGIDPTGLMSLGSIGTASFISVGMASLGGAAYGNAKGWSQEQIFYANLKNSGAALAVTLGFFGVAAGLIGLGAATADALLFSSITFGVAGTGLAGANMASAYKNGDNVDRVFATAGFLFSLVGLRVVARNTTAMSARQTALEGAITERVNALGEGRTHGAAGVLYDPVAETFVGGRSTRAGGTSMKVSDFVLDMLDAMNQTIKDSRGGRFGACVEPRTISAADRARLDRMWSAVVRMSDGKPLPACEACRPMLEQLGIQDAASNDALYAPIIWIAAGLSGDIGDDDILPTP